MFKYYSALKQQKTITAENFPDQLKKFPERFKESLQTYYTEYFSHRALLNVIHLKNFNFREFGFIYDVPKKHKEKLRFDRNLNFDTPTLLKNYMATSVPTHAYVGGIYNRHLQRGRGVLMSDVIHRELGFDIDIGDFDMIRKKICKCTGKQICKICIELPKEAAIFVIDTLKEDFGLKKFAVVFSGGGGIHIWVQDGIAGMFSKNIPSKYMRNHVRYEKEIRLSIINYISPIEVTKRGKLVLRDSLIRPVTLRNRIFTYLLRNFLVKSPMTILLKTGLTVEDVTTIRAKISQEGIDSNFYEWLINSKFHTLPSKRKFDNIFFKYRYPRYDKGPTQDVVRVLRIPDSIHGKTGNICTLIKDLEGFSVDDIPTVFNYVD